MSDFFVTLYKTVINYWACRYLDQGGTTIPGHVVRAARHVILGHWWSMLHIAKRSRLYSFNLRHFLGWRETEVLIVSLGMLMQLADKEWNIAKFVRNWICKGSERIMCEQILVHPNLIMYFWVIWLMRIYSKFKLFLQWTKPAMETHLSW